MVKDTNKRINVKMTKELYATIEEEAKSENRSVSNMINYIILKYYKEKEA